MTIPDELVEAAAEAYRPDCPHSYQRPSICPICLAHAKRALQAAFAMLPECEAAQDVAARGLFHPLYGGGNIRYEDIHPAPGRCRDLASDALAALAREFGGQE